MSKSRVTSSSTRAHIDEIRGDEIRLLIDWHHVGAIIGKSGTSVKRIREESGCSINIIAPTNQSAPQQIDRIMTIRGNNEQATRAIAAIAQTVVDSIQQRARDRGDDSNSAATNTTSVKLLVHRAAVGAVIGKSGESIRQTQTDTGARIQVSSEPLGNSTDKTVTISGTPDVIEAAVGRVLEQLETSPLRPGTKVQHFVPGPSLYAYGNDDSAPSSSPAGPISIQKIAIPSICTGCVIGRGGTIIRDLRAQSGTNISIADPDPATPDERVVTITGSPQGIQTAVYLIRQCVESYVPPSQAEDGQDNEQEQ